MVNDAELGQWVMGQMGQVGQQLGMGHVGHGSVGLPVTY